MLPLPPLPDVTYILDCINIKILDMDILKMTKSSTINWKKKKGAGVWGLGVKGGCGGCTTLLSLMPSHSGIDIKAVQR